MELILKQPKGKDPFLGILFTSEFEAERLNQSWPNTYQQNYLYSIFLEPGKGSIDLTLKLNGFQLDHKYRNLQYDPVKLSRWLLLNRQEKQYNFAHVVRELSKDKVVRTSVNGALWVLKVKEISLIQIEV